MSTQSIFAEKTVSITELRKNPNQYFMDEPVVVLSNNKPAGYMISAELYEQMVHFIEQAAPVTASHFRPSKSRMAEITQRGAELLASASDEDLSDFVE